MKSRQNKITYKSDIDQWSEEDMIEMYNRGFRDGHSKGLLYDMPEHIEPQLSAEGHLEEILRGKYTVENRYHYSIVNAENHEDIRFDSEAIYDIRDIEGIFLGYKEEKQALKFGNLWLERVFGDKSNLFKVEIYKVEIKIKVI